MSALKSTVTIKRENKVLSHILLQWNPATYSRWYLNGNKQVGSRSFSFSLIFLRIRHSIKQKVCDRFQNLIFFFNNSKNLHLTTVIFARNGRKKMRTLTWFYFAKHGILGKFARQETGLLLIVQKRYIQLHVMHFISAQ